MEAKWENLERGMKKIKHAPQINKRIYVNWIQIFKFLRPQDVTSYVVGGYQLKQMWNTF